MNTAFLSGGPERQSGSREHQNCREALRMEIADKYAERRAQAGWIGRIVLWWQARREFRREWKRIEPSDRALWLRA